MVLVDVRRHHAGMTSEARLLRLTPQLLYRSLDEERLTHVLRACSTTRAALTAEHKIATESFGAADAATVRRWLSERLTRFEPMDRVVVMLWPTYRFGIEVSLADLVGFHESLWLPGSDDLWVVPPDRSWFLELDHEEHAHLYRVLGSGDATMA